MGGQPASARRVTAAMGARTAPWSRHKADRGPSTHPRRRRKIGACGHPRPSRPPGPAPREAPGRSRDGLWQPTTTGQIVPHRRSRRPTALERAQPSPPGGRRSDTPQRSGPRPTSIRSGAEDNPMIHLDSASSKTGGCVRWKSWGRARRRQVGEIEGTVRAKGVKTSDLAALLRESSSLFGSASRLEDFGRFHAPRRS